jgi:predicted ester cyclase
MIMVRQPGFRILPVVLAAVVMFAVVGSLVHLVCENEGDSGTHLGEFLGEVPTGERMTVEEVFFLRAEDGKFVDFWALEDSLGRMRQLGLLPSKTGES